MEGAKMRRIGKKGHRPNLHKLEIKTNLNPTLTICCFANNPLLIYSFHIIFSFQNIRENILLNIGFLMDGGNRLCNGEWTIDGLVATYQRHNNMDEKDAKEESGRMDRF
jgi:hypothetical protein